MRPTYRLGSILTLIVLTSSSAPLSAEDWGRFRGPNGSGISTTAALPASFDDSRLLWAAEVPFGRSSPSIGDELVYLTAVDGDELITLAVSRGTGEIVWRQSIQRPRRAELHAATDSSTPTAATDGQNVFVFFQEFGLVSYDAEGRERWRLPLGPFRNFYGMASSPVLVGGKVILLCDQGGGSYLLAVDATTGAEVWRRGRAKRRENYTTPVLYPSPSDPRLLLVYGSKYLDAYDPSTGEEIWALPGLGAGPVSSPVIDGDRVFVVGPNHADEPLEPYTSLLDKHDQNGDGQLDVQELEGTWMARNFAWVDFDGDSLLSAEDWSGLGDELEVESWGLHAIEMADLEKPPSVAWNHRQNVSYIPSLLAYDGVVYMVEDSILTSLDAETGETLKRGRLGSGKTYASPVAAGGEILFSQLEGKVSVVRADGQWEVLHNHDFGEEIHATPALTDGVLYIRTRGRLLAYAAEAKEEPMGMTELTDLATRYAEAWSSREPARLASFYTENGSLTVNDGAPSVGREAVEQTAREFMTAFPDMVVRLIEVRREGDLVNFHWHWTGTNTGPGGTGNAVDLRGHEQWTLDAHGLILESRGHYDDAEYQRQLSAE